MALSPLDPSPRKVDAYVGLGSNLQDPRRQVTSALDALAAIPRTRLAARSSLWLSAPRGYAGQPDFVNAVARVETLLSAQELLGALHSIERAHGRERSFPNAPRTLDLDLLMYGDVILDTPDLTLPHPRMHERAFVLKPLLEIAGDADIPGRGHAAGFLSRLQDQACERIA